MTELVMRKRQGRAGEMGLFVESEVFEDDFSHIKIGAEVNVKATTPRSLRQIKFAWALATKIAEACPWVETKEDCMDFMLIEAKHFRRIYDPIRKIAILKPKPTNFGAMDGTEYTRLLKRITHVAVTIMVPGMDDSDLKAEIEAMIEPEMPASAPEALSATKPARQRKRDPDALQGQGEPASGTAGNANPAAPLESSPRSEVSRPAGAPTNEAEYLIAARAWIAKQTDHAAALAYLDDTPQIELRAKCRLSVGTGKMIRRELAEHCEKKKKESA